MSSPREATAQHIEVTATPTVVPDDLLRQIIGVGQVDVLISVATLDHAAGISAIVRSVRACMQTCYPRLRTALLHLDRGSRDGTPLAAMQAWEEGGRVRSGSGLRTTHFIESTIDAASDGDIARVLLAAADLLQVRALVVLDADVEPDGSGDAAALAAPILDGPADVVAPRYARGPADGLLVSQLVRPLTQAVFCRTLSEPLLPSFASSGRFAAHAIYQAWNRTAAERGTRYWIAAEALAGDFEVRQCDCSARRPWPTPSAPALPELFMPAVTSVFSCIDTHADAWRARTDCQAIPTDGAGQCVEAGSPTTARLEWHQAFARDMKNIGDVLSSILEPDTWATLQVTYADPSDVRFPDEVWAAVLTDFVLAFHHGVMRRDHIVQALLPLYRARSAAFAEGHGRDSAATAQAALVALASSVERTRPRLVRHWANQPEVQHG